MKVNQVQTTGWFAVHRVILKHPHIFTDRTIGLWIIFAAQFEIGPCEVVSPPLRYPCDHTARWRPRGTEDTPIECWCSPLYARPSCASAVADPM